MPRARATAGLVVCVGLWGLVFVAVHELLPVIDAVQITTLRFMLVSVVFATLLVARRAWRPRLSGREWALVLVAGVMAVPGSQLAIVEGQRYLSPPIASLIVTTSPAVAACLAAAFLGERLSLSQAAGFVLALAGVAVMVVVGAGTGADLGASDPLRASVSLITPVSWALYTLLSRPLALQHPAVGTVGLSMMVGTVALTPLMPHALDGVGRLDAGEWWWLVFLAVGGTAGPYLLWSAGLRVLAVNRTAAFMYLVPFFALLWTASLLGTVPPATTLLGGAIVLAGVALTQRRARLPATAAEPLEALPRHGGAHSAIGGRNPQ
jgi:drug/metabolite transporter (DMT)-like permease